MEDKKELIKFNYLKDTTIGRMFFSIILIGMMLGFIFLIITTFSIKHFFLSIFITIFCLILIIVCLILYSTLNSEYTVIFYEDAISLNNNIINISDIEFIGIVYHSMSASNLIFGNSQYCRYFEVQAKDNYYRLRLSKKCRNYFKDYCNLKGLKNNL